MKVAVVGAGLAGSDCSWILANGYGCEVTLFEMKSKSPTPAQSEPHHFAELVCSNSLKSTSKLNPAGLLKTEMKALGSLIVPMAETHKVPAGEALAVDREGFSGGITQVLKNHKNIKVVEIVVDSIAAIFESDTFDACVIATGPLTADALANDLRKLTGAESCYFYDAIAPIINGETVDMNIAFKGNRSTRTAAYEKRPGGANDPHKLTVATPLNPDEPQPDSTDSEDTEELQGDYVNLPLNKEEYFTFVEAVNAGAKVPFHDFEKPQFFNGCQPIEVLAASGPRTLSFGPMKPKGFDDPRTGRMPYALVQLRKEKLGDESFNMVGFQTRLTWTAQKEIFKTLPGLQNAEFFRFGSMHRNTYLVSPAILNKDYSLKADPRVYLAGQIMGVEGYLESAAMGLWIGHVVGRKISGQKPLTTPPSHCAIGTLARYVIEAEIKKFSPMNVHWGLFEALSDTDLEDCLQDLSTESLAQVNKWVQSGKKRSLEKSVKRHILSNRATLAFNNWWNV